MNKIVGSCGSRLCQYEVPSSTILLAQNIPESEKVVVYDMGTVKQSYPNRRQKGVFWSPPHRTTFRPATFET